LHDASDGWTGIGKAALLGLLAALLLLGSAALTPLERSQEARVLETAREMIGQGWREWIIPHCNGRVRLQKPPLAYWLSAASFKALGVSVWSGRLPMALAGWATLVIVWALGRYLFENGAGLISAGILLGSYLFARYAHYAETDILATFFATSACGCIWLGANATSRGRRLFWHQLSGLAIGLTTLAKGPQAIFPLLFLLALAIGQKRWRIMTQWLLSGAPVICLLIALPWWLYIARAPESAILAKELHDVAEGTDHGKPPWTYIPLIFQATAPWCGLLILAIGVATERWRRDMRLRVLLLWSALFFITLSIIPQKQDHYLLPLMPPLAILIGWFINEAIAGNDPRLRRWATAILLITALAGLAGPIVLLFIARKARGHLFASDVIGSVIIAAGLLALVVVLIRRSLKAAMIMAMLSSAIALTYVLSIGGPSLEMMDYRQVAAAIDRDYGRQNLVMIKDETLPLCFYMKRIIPFYATLTDWSAATSNDAHELILWEQKGSEQLPPFSVIDRYRMGKRDIVVLRAGPK